MTHPPSNDRPDAPELGGDRGGDRSRDHDDPDVKVSVSFTMSDQPNYEDRVDDSTTLGTVRKAAMVHFGAEEDPNHVYYLTHDRERQGDEVTVGKLAGKARRLKLRLVKELTQG